MVTINGVFSNEKNIMYGVPQGSVTELVLSILCINDLCNTKIVGLEVTDVDDIYLLFLSNICKNVKNKAEIGVKRVPKEFSNRKLFLNISKTGFIAFSIRNVHTSNFSTDEIKIHSCNNENSSFNNYQKILRVKRVKYFLPYYIGMYTLVEYVV